MLRRGRAMLALAHKRAGQNLFGGVTVDVYQKVGTRYVLQQLSFDAGADAEADKFIQNADALLLMERLESFISKAASAMSFQWYSQNKWLKTARPQMQELRGIRKNMGHFIHEPAKLAICADLVTIALDKSRPYKFMTGPLNMWLHMHSIAAQYRDKYQVDGTEEQYTYTEKQDNYAGN